MSQKLSKKVKDKLRSALSDIADEAFGASVPEGGVAVTPRQVHAHKVLHYDIVEAVRQIDPEFATSLE